MIGPAILSRSGFIRPLFTAAPPEFSLWQNFTLAEFHFGRISLWQNFTLADFTLEDVMMLKYRTAALASAAALCVVAGAAALAMDQSHVMKIDLPDGSIARIDYQGDVAPQVRVEPAVKFMPAAFVDPFEPASFDAFDAIAADMNRQAETMVRQMDLLEREAIASDGTARPTVVADFPAGNVTYRSVSTGDGKSVCTQIWQMASQGDHQPPRIISASYGNCAKHGTSQPAPGATATVSQPGATAASTTA